MADLSLLAGLVAGPAVGLLATLAMDRIMGRLPEGETPPKVAASVLADTSVDAAPDRLATWIHYVAGGGSGLLFVGLTAAVGTLGAGVAVTLAVASLIMLGLMVGFFVVVPLPRTDGLAGQRLSRVRRDWATAAAGYVIVAATLIGAVTLVTGA